MFDYPSRDSEPSTALLQPARKASARRLWDQVRARDYQPWDVHRDGDRTTIDGSDTEAALAAIRVRLGQPPSAENR